MFTALRRKSSWVARYLARFVMIPFVMIPSEYG